MERRSDHDRIPAEDLLDCVWRMDLDLRITYVSPVAESLLGIPATVLIGSSLADLTTPEDHAQLREMLQAALTAEDRSAGLIHETRVRHADGHLVPFEVHSRILLGRDGQPSELVGVARDISRRHKRERRDRQREQTRLQEQKQRALAALAGQVAAILRPLLEADSAAGAGAAPDGSAAAREQAAELLGTLDLIAGARPRPGEDLDVDDHVARILAELRATLPTGTHLVHQPGAGGSTIRADGEALALALGELVRNAAAALPGGGRISVVTGLREPESTAELTPAGILGAPRRPWVSLEVRDDGPGFDHATRERVCEPFFTTRPDAAGLGLARVHGIVTGHDGRMEVESRPGQGTCVRLLLPARFADEVLASGPGATGPAARPRILLVDDDPGVRHYCERVLRSGGFEVLSCVDGVEALAVIAGDEAIDAVVLDWALPGLDGRRVYEQVARRQPALPLLVISGHGPREFQALGGVDDATPWLAKPFTPPALLAAVRALLPSAAGPEPGS